MNHASGTVAPLDAELIQIATTAIARKLLTRAYHLLAARAAGTPATMPRTTPAA